MRLSDSIEPRSHSTSEGSDPALLYDGKDDVADDVSDEEGTEAELILPGLLGRVSAFGRFFPSGRPSIVPTSQYNKRPVGVRPLRGSVGGRAILNRSLDSSVEAQRLHELLTVVFQAVAKVVLPRDCQPRLPACSKLTSPCPFLPLRPSNVLQSRLISHCTSIPVPPVDESQLGQRVL
jgi:hypothetical protein